MGHYVRVREASTKNLIVVPRAALRASHPKRIVFFSLKDFQHHTDRDMQTDRQKDRQTDRQTDEQTIQQRKG